MSEKILMRNCQTCKNYKIGIDGICKDCTLHRAQPNYSNWEWNGIEDGCEFCNGEASHTSGYADISVSELGKYEVLKVACNPCPPYTDCALKEIMPINSAFIINYCPICGKRLAND